MRVSYSIGEFYCTITKQKFDVTEIVSWLEYAYRIFLPRNKMTLCNKNIVLRHDVIQALFPGLLSDLRTTPYLADEDEMIAAGLGPYLKKFLAVTGGGCHMDTPVSIKLFLGRSLVFLDEQGRKTASRPVEKVQVKFTKSWFTGNTQ